jgi:hypothetical protein
VWWFQVKDVNDYVFSRFAVGATAEEVAPARSGTLIGEIRANLKVEFVVVRYKPKALVGSFSRPN